MKKLTALGLFMTGFMVVSAAGFSHAGDLKVSGFADVLYFITNEASDPIPPATGKNTTEQQFVAKGEIDFEKEEGPVTFRLDLDFPGSTSGGMGATLANTNIGAGGGIIGANSFGDTIEQAKFDWAIPNAPFGLTLTAGIFNTPIGYELQDAPDRTLITFGQLFQMLPINHAGIEISGSMGMISASLLYVDEWRSITGTGAALPTAEENSFGGTLAFDLMPTLNISIGYLTSEQNIAIQDEDVLDVILSGMIMPMPALEVTYALEFVTDENNDAFGITVGAVHGPHGLTIRYDSVDCDATTAFAGCTFAGVGAANTPTTITVGAFVDLASSLQARLEWSSLDTDTSAAPDTDAVLLQFVATFM